MELMDKQLKSFLNTFFWKVIENDNNVLQAIISHDDFCKYVFTHGKIIIDDRVLEVKCNGFSDSLGLTYTLTLLLVFLFLSEQI